MKFPFELDYVCSECKRKNGATVFEAAEHLEREILLSCQCSALHFFDCKSGELLTHDRLRRYSKKAFRVRAPADA